MVETINIEIRDVLDKLATLADKTIPEITKKNFDVEKLLNISDERLERYHEYLKIYDKYINKEKDVPYGIDFEEVKITVVKGKNFIDECKLNPDKVKKLQQIRENVYMEYKYWDNIKSSIEVEQVKEIGLFGVEVEEIKHTKNIDIDAYKLSKILRKFVKGIDFLIKDYKIKVAEKEKEDEKKKAPKEVGEGRNILMQFIERSDFAILTEKQIKKKLTSTYNTLAKESTVKIAIVQTYMMLIERVDQVIIDETMGIADRGNSVHFIEAIRQEIIYQSGIAIETGIVDTGNINTFLRKLVYETGLSNDKLTNLIFNAENNLDEKKPRNKREKAIPAEKNSLGSLIEALDNIDVSDVIEAS